MIVYPAIDIHGGKAVRLVEGDFARETIFDSDPVDAARRWEQAGAAWIHIVDLDGARAGRPVNTDAISRIRKAVGVHLQLGGGLRTMAHMEADLALGIDRIVLGSVALSSPPLVREAVRTFGMRVAVGLDARDGKLAANGWIEQSVVDAVDVARRLRAEGVRTFVFTDIGRDGTLGGPNLSALKEVIDAVDADVIASGGIGSLADLDAVRTLGAAGVIVGRAIYDGTLELRDVLARVAQKEVA
ncbi:MAG: 1-(5-phosphoribosyl)-5-[(5-phosphoribosylamino)methylideneamino]imidazole-4-carboxamide isomerase [Chloroflexota bacterium]|nr:1-(5-phosphoribosyl)-5-[(5-phosphoribosylamino)methylideneamino]imidazole-4-carboxamide isomerase [Chloroflexota bacterium]